MNVGFERPKGFHGFSSLTARPFHKDERAAATPMGQVPLKENKPATVQFYKITVHRPDSTIYLVS